MVVMSMMGRMTRRLRRRNEQGFTLLTTLGVLLIATLLIVMMLSASMNTSVLVQRKAEDAHELRAADGAISAATGFLRDTPADEVDAEKPCAENASELPPFAEELPSSFEVDDLPVRVECDELKGSGEVVPISTSGTVKVLGDGSTTSDNAYWGDAPWMTGCAMGTTGANCFPWRDAFKNGPLALVGAGRPNTAGWPSMVYAGAQPLKIGGDLELRAGSIGVRDPSIDDPGIKGPAMSISGDYVQGFPGTGNGIYGGCGILQDNGADVYEATRVNAGGSPLTCNDTGAQGLSVDNAAIAPAITWTPDKLRDNEKTIGACPATTLVKIEPGAYNASETAKLNAWLAEGNCDNKTFYFKQGDYWFDVDDPANDNALHFNDHTSNAVFGMPKNWTDTNDYGAEDEDFPEACDPRAYGVSITLTARTTIRHDKGRVAICGPSAGVPAIWQSEAPGNTDHVLTPNPANTTSAGGLTGSGNSRSTGDLPCPFFTVDWPWNWPRAACQRDVSVTYSGFDDDGSAATDPGPGPLNSAIIRIVGSHSRANDGPAYTQFDVTVPNVTGADGSPLAGFNCRARYFRIPQRTSEPLAYDLLAPPGAQGGDPGASENNCWTRFTDRDQLRKATIKVTFHLKTHPRILFNDTENTKSCLWAGFFSGCEYSFSINSLEIIEGRTYSPTAASLSGPWDSGTPASNILNWPNGVRAHYNGSASTVRLSGFTNPYDPALPTEQLDQVGLLLTGKSYYGNGDAAYTQVRVYESDGTTKICGAAFDRVAGNGHTRYLDLKTTDTNLAKDLGGFTRCSSALTSAMELEDAVVDVTIKTDCSSIVAPLTCWAIDEWLELNHASLVTVSSFTEPDPADRPVMHVTVNDDPGASDDALFNVFGTVSLPRTVLDVFWNGPAPEHAVVEGDFLVVSGIGSFGFGPDHEVGVLCCGPVKLKDRKVQLRAIVDVPGEGERLRSVATVTIHDEDEAQHIYAAGSRVTTDEYRICNTSDVSNTAACGPVNP